MKSITPRFVHSIIVASSFIACYLFLHPGPVATFAQQAGNPNQPTIESTPRLLPPQPVERLIKGGEAHSYTVELRGGDFLRVVVEQHDIDLVVSLQTRAGVELVETNLFRERGPEPLSYYASAAGEYLLEVRTASARALQGRYSLSFVTNPVTNADKSRAAAERLLNATEKLFGNGSASELRQAATKIKQSLPVWRQLKDQYWLAYSLNKLGVIHNELGDPKKALDFYNQALVLRRSIGDQRGEASTLANIADSYNLISRKDLARDFFQQALAIHRATGNRLLEWETLADIGHIYTELANHQKALESYNDALLICRALGDRVATAGVLNDAGRVYFLLKDRDKALSHYTEALSLNEGGDEIYQIVILTNIGDVYFYLDTTNQPKALGYYDQALKHIRARGDREREFQLIIQIGHAYRSLGQPAKAIEYFEQAIQRFQRPEDRVKQGDFLLQIGFTRNGLGHWQEAVRDYKRALALFSAAKKPVGEAEALKSIADILFSRDRNNAIAYNFQLLRIQQRLKDRYGEAITLSEIGVLHYGQRNWQISLQYLNNAKAIFASLGSQQNVARELVNIGNVYYKQDRMPEALKYYEEALTIHRSGKNRAGEATALNNIGLVYDVTDEMQKALEYYAQALQISHDIGDKHQEASILMNMGLIHGDLGDDSKALSHYESALQIRRELKDSNGEADALINSGVSYRAIDKPTEALSLFQQALQIRQAQGDKYGQANAFFKIAETFLALEKKREAIDHFEKARSLYRVLNEPRDEVEILITLAALEMTLEKPLQTLTYARQGQSVVQTARIKGLYAVFELLIGGAYIQLKQMDRGLAHLNKAQKLFRAGGNREGEGWTLTALGIAYFEVDQVEKALSSFHEVLSLARSMGSRKMEADALKVIAEVYDRSGRVDDALASYLQSLSIYSSLALTNEEAAVLLSIALIYQKQGEKEKAAEYLTQALFRNPELKPLVDRLSLENKRGTYDSLGERKERQEHLTHYFESYQNARRKGLTGIEAEHLSRAMGVMKEHEPELAIIFGKQALAKYLEVRANTGRYSIKLGNDTYLRSFSSTCRDLADLLIEKGRLYEAEQVMNNLKQEEYLEYVRRDASELAALSQRPDLRPEERKLFAEYAARFDRINLIGNRYGELKAKKDKLQGARLSDAEEAEMKQLGADLAVANKGHKLFMDRIKSEFDARWDVAYELKQNRGLQSDLKNWGNGAVILRTLVAQERYRVILITPEYQTDGKTDIAAAELNKKILAFRQTLMNPALDPIPQARELYDILIKPIEPHLQNANTLIWSLDGALRYLPLAALHDGNRYMAERYQQVIMTLASRTRLSDEVSNNWRGLGLGVSDQWGTFSALPAVVGELESIIRDERTTDTAKDSPVGVMPGLRLLNKEFTAATFADALGRRFSVVHIASHFSLAPDDAEKSFLLLGDGNRLSLKTIDDAPEYAFTGVELLTLSSCNTGVNWNDAGYGSDGNEVENFGLIAQNRGAKAVIATLWSVADDSTSVLMREFYRIRSTTIGITKAEALQRAQLALLHGDPSGISVGPHVSRADLVGSPAQNPDTQSRSGRTGKPYAHPYYWAPFILIGNWR